MADIKKLDLKSKNITDTQKVKLKELFPEIITEGKIDFERLRLTLGNEIDDGEERFGMTWPGKRDCFKVIQEPSIGTLKPCKEESVDFETTENLFIEGDNLEVLKLMQKSYYGKVKMIYIDPPYNTGNEFIYPDKYSESLETYLAYTGQVDDEGRKFSTNTEADGRFHTRWLNMMYPRLFLAKNLLRDDGVIFISIDDNEMKNLRALCDEVFGEDNFLANVIWQHSVQPKGYTDIFSVHHNYVLCYRKTDRFILKPVHRTEKDNKNYSNPDNDPNGDWRSGDVRNALYRRNLIYDIITPSGNVISPPPNGWRWSQETLHQKIASGEIIFNEDQSRIIRKTYLKNQYGRAPETIWFADDVGSTREAASLLKSLFDGVLPFDTAKPVRLIHHMCEISGLEPNDIVLDFFSGSASLAEAILTEGNFPYCRYILIQLPEHINTDKPHGKVAEQLRLLKVSDIGKERIRRVIKKIKKEKEGTLDLGEQKQDLGFKVFKLDKSNFKIWDGNVEEKPIQDQLAFAIDHIDPNSKEDNILYEILLKSGFELTTPVETLTLEGKKVYSVAEGALLICLEMNLTTELIRAIAKMEPQRVVCLDSGFEGNDQLKTNAVQIMKSFDVESFRTV